MAAEIPIEEAFAQMNETLRQILRWVKFQSMDRARQIIEKEVALDSKRILVYELADGDRGRPEVAWVSRVPSSTIQAWWDRWYRLGILESSPKRKGMVRKLCGIEEVGLEIPKDLKAVIEGRSELPSPAANSETVDSPAREV